jgi:phosphatidylserine decarboxylase
MARYALKEVIVIALLSVLLTTLLAAYIHWGAALAPAALMLFLLWFYRDPPRRIPPGDNLLLSPADGWILEVQRDVPDADGTRMLRIAMFLSVFDVHVNRAPCAGRVTGIDYRRGKFMNALNAESSFANESNTLTLEPNAPLPGPVRVKQIAGGLARRIVCTPRNGDVLAAGERFGMIKLGSRAELWIREDHRWEVLVAPRRHVRGGATVLARLRSELPRDPSQGPPS